MNLVMWTASCVGDASDVASRSDPAIYGEDGRQEPFDADTRFAELGQYSTAALTRRSHLRGTDARGLVQWWGSATHGDLIRACPTTRFREQPVRSRCSATLIDGDLMVSAAHCISESCGSGDPFCVPPADVAVVFNSRMESATQVAPVVAARDLYTIRDRNGDGTVNGADLVALSWQRLDVNGNPATREAVGPLNSSLYLDLVVFQLDRPVRAPYRPARIRSGGASFELSRGDSVATIGYPSGLPLKIEATGKVLNPINPNRRAPANADGRDYFTFSGDTFGGNSGSGVFDASGELAGILVFQDTSTDYGLNGECQVHRVYPEPSCDSRGVCRGGSGAIYIHQAIRAMCASGYRSVLCSNASAVAPVACSGSECEECSGPNCEMSQMPTSGVCTIGTPGACEGDVFGRPVCSGERGFRACTPPEGERRDGLSFVGECLCSNGQWECLCQGGGQSVGCEPDPAECRWVGPEAMTMPVTRSPVAACAAVPGAGGGTGTLAVVIGALAVWILRRRRAPRS